MPGVERDNAHYFLNLMSEERVMVAISKVEAPEVEASGLRKDLIEAMYAVNSSKEKIQALTTQLNAEKMLVKQKDEQVVVANQKMKNAVAKAVHTFQLMDKYNAVLFGWYFKSFELLRRYLVKHDLEIDLKDLDFEAIDKEIEVDEASQAAAAEDLLAPEKEGDAPSS